MRWTRRRGLFACLAVLAATGAAAAPLAAALARPVPAEDTRVVLPTGRAYVLHTPPALRADPGLADGRPALVFLHGLRSNPADAARSTGFDRLADRDGVLVAYPEGVNSSFNAGLCCGTAAALGVDDVSFLTSVVADLHRRGAGRIGLVGFSNGAMMAYRFACERPDLVSAVGVLAGTLEIPRCDGRIRVLAVHGALDHTVPLAGLAWSTVLDCYLRPVTAIPAAAPGSDVQLVVLPHLRHRWTVHGDPLDASAAFWKFTGMSRAG